MRHSFENIIRDYNEIAKDRLDESLSSREEQDLNAELGFRMRRATRSRQSERDAQERIYAIQERKQEIMQKLKERIANLDTERELERRPGERFVEQIDDTFIVRGEGERHDALATKGEILTDMDWGLYYYLDPQSVDRNVRKRYLIEDAKQELQKLLDEQITIDEVASGYTPDLLRNAYEKRAESTGEATGFLAERMTKGFLKQLSYDLPDADFDILEADAFQDVTNKMDFIVRRRLHERGVEVQEQETGRVGVQFTTNLSPEVQAHKAAQVDRVKGRLEQSGEKVRDLVLVSLPANEVREAYNAWREDPQPGGPQKLWSMQTKEHVFGGVMQDILESEQIAEQWQQVEDAASPAQEGEV